MNAERLLHERSAPLPSSKASVSEAASAEPAVVARSETKSIDANPNASTPGGAIFAASATMGMYPNIKPPDATTLLIARGTSGAAEGVREPSQASTTSRRAKPHRELTAAPAAKDDLSVNENVRTFARSAPAALRYSAVASMPPSMDSSSMTLYPQAGSVNCAYANVVNVTSDVGGRRYANKNSAHVATRGVKHGANGASALFVAAAIADVRKERNVRPSRYVVSPCRGLPRVVASPSAPTRSSSRSPSSKRPKSSSSSSASPKGKGASANARLGFLSVGSRVRLLSRGSGMKHAAAAAASAKTPASDMTVLASVSLSKGMESAVAVKLPADRTSIPAACICMAFFSSRAPSCTSAPSAPVSQIAKTTTEATPATYRLFMERTRA
mmetsp:Transcript_15065/g.63525  ORF Transcript_15065/g.63525 Transcript_15065/m.63525 type:complete len:385 (-) Transcript_15065:542-1696(-)